MTAAMGYAAAVEAVLTRFRDESKWWNPGYQGKVRADLRAALEPCPARYIDELLARKDLFPYQGDADEMFRNECDKVLLKKKDAASNPIAELPGEVRDFLGSEPVPNDLLRALGESATLRAELVRAGQVGFHFGGDVSKSNKPGADAAFTDRTGKKIYLPSWSTDYVRTLIFEIQNVLSDGAFSAVETAAREAGISAHRDSSAAEFARAIADIEIANNARTADIMRRASTETKLQPESPTLRTAPEHLATVVRGKATVQQDYEHKYHRILLVKLERFAETGAGAGDQVAGLMVKMQNKISEYEKIAAANRNVLAD